MLLKYFYDKKLAQASYMVGCAETGEALVIDAARHIEPYLKAAQDEGLKITHVTETHIHADFASGSRELAHQTGAKLYLSDMGDADWKYQFEHTVLLHDGDSWMVGNIKVEVLHTPGHTPEHICFIITDTKNADKPIGIFTGDFLFVGDVGRPDLLEEAAGIANTKIKGAEDLFASIQNIKKMPDYLQIWPGHGAGSACGKALGAIPSTTLGYEKLFNPALQLNNRGEFVEWLLEGQPEAPRYFARMKKVNKEGPELLENLNKPKILSRTDLDLALQNGYLVADMRTLDDFARAYLSGTVNVPATTDKFSTYLGWLVDYHVPFYFIAYEKDVPRILEGLRAIGVDDIPGYFLADVVVGNTDLLDRLNAANAADRLQQNGVLVLDVRNKSEYDKKHLVGAKHIPLGHIPQRLGELPKTQPILVHCASGLRSQIVTSLLRRYGFEKVITINDEFDKLAQLLPTE